MFKRIKDALRAEDPNKEVTLDKPYRIYRRDDASEDYPIIGFETDSEGKPILSQATLINYNLTGDSVTKTRVVGKFYEHNLAENCWNKYNRKELETNKDWKRPMKIIGTVLTAVGLAVLIFTQSGCAGIDFRRTMGYVTDTAQKMCEMQVVKDINKDLGGLKPEEWCEVADNVFPYLESMAELVDIVKPKACPVPAEHPIPPNPYE